MDDTRDSALRLQHELAIARFLVPEKRARWKYLVERPSRRADLMDELEDAVFLPAAIIPAEYSHLADCDLERFLKERGAPARCYSLSIVPGCRSVFLDLSDALFRTHGEDSTTLLSCIPGRLAYFEGERRRLVLWRPK